MRNERLASLMKRKNQLVTLAFFIVITAALTFIALVKGWELPSVDKNFYKNHVVTMFIIPMTMAAELFIADRIQLVSQAIKEEEGRYK